MQLWPMGQEMPDDLQEGLLTLRKSRKTEKLLFYYLQTLLFEDGLWSWFSQHTTKKGTKATCSS